MITGTNFRDVDLTEDRNLLSGFQSLVSDVPTKPAPSLQREFDMHGFIMSHKADLQSEVFSSRLLEMTADEFNQLNGENLRHFMISYILYNDIIVQKLGRKRGIFREISDMCTDRSVEMIIPVVSSWLRSESSKNFP
jgi:hypothetical protein